MPVKRKLNKKRTKVPRNVKINSKSSKRASQKKRGRRGRGRKSQRGGNDCSHHKPFSEAEKTTVKQKVDLKTLTGKIRKLYNALPNKNKERRSITEYLIGIIEDTTKRKKKTNSMDNNTDATILYKSTHIDVHSYIDKKIREIFGIMPLLSDHKYEEHNNNSIQQADLAEFLNKINDDNTNNF